MALQKAACVSSVAPLDLYYNFICIIVFLYLQTVLKYVGWQHFLLRGILPAALNLYRGK